MHSRRAGLALCVVSAVSCGDATGPRDEIAGLYALQRVNAQALPTSGPCGGGVSIVSADLALSSTGQATLTRRLITQGASAASVYLVVTGRYLVTERAVVVYGAGRWSNEPRAFRAELRFDRVDAVLRGAGEGPECDAQAAVEDYERVVPL